MNGKPQLYSNCTYAFDSTEDHTFKYLWGSENNQSIGNLLFIRDNDTNEQVYLEREDTLLLKHTLPKNTLENGKTYNVRLKVIDSTDEQSDISDCLIFKCLTKPSFQLDFVDGTVVRNASCSVGINYNQLEGEELQYYYLAVYDTNKNFMYKTSGKYNVGNKTVLNDLMDNKSYYVKGYGQTVNHIDIETDLVCFNVEYIKPETYSYMTVENRKNNGDIQFTSFIVSIEGKGIDGTELYDNGYVDTVNGVPIKFDENFTFKNGLLMLTMKNIIINKPFLIMTNDKQNSFTLTWCYGICDYENNIKQYFVEMKSTSKNTVRIICSNMLEIDNLSDSIINVVLKTKNDFSDIVISKAGDE